MSVTATTFYVEKYGLPNARYPVSGRLEVFGPFPETDRQRHADDNALENRMAMNCGWATRYRIIENVA